MRKSMLEAVAHTHKSLEGQRCKKASFTSWKYASAIVLEGGGKEHKLRKNERDKFVAKGTKKIDLKRQ
jgi:hypothetical protein